VVSLQRFLAGHLARRIPPAGHVPPRRRISNR
jgi:hypothetical protein